MTWGEGDKISHFWRDVVFFELPGLTSDTLVAYIALNTRLIILHLSYSAILKDSQEVLFIIHLLFLHQASLSTNQNVAFDTSDVQDVC